jgi:hypothetical protein
LIYLPGGRQWIEKSDRHLAGPHPWKIAEGIDGVCTVRANLEDDVGCPEQFVPRIRDASTLFTKGRIREAGLLAGTRFDGNCKATFDQGGKNSGDKRDSAFSGESFSGNTDDHYLAPPNFNPSLLELWGVMCSSGCPFTTTGACLLKGLISSGS